MVTLEDILRVLRESRTPLSVPEIAKEVGAEVRACDALLWQNTEDFVWQPGHRWTVARTRSHSRRHELPETPDARAADSTAPQDQLRALTLSSGLTIAIDRRPLDSDAFFSVRSVGNRIALTLNSSHEVFSELPLPFDGVSVDSPYKTLCEMLLSAWALYEDGIPEGSARRAAQESRLFWGRRVVEMLREPGDD
jgi:hypothetical protein